MVYRPLLLILLFCALIYIYIHICMYISFSIYKGTSIHTRKTQCFGRRDMLVVVTVGLGEY